MIRKALMLAAAGLMTITAASTAYASNGPALTGKDACPRSYVCVWDNTTFSGAPTWKSQGNLGTHKSSHGLSIFNNGVSYPGADHIHYSYQYAVDDRPRYGCLHYPGDTPNSKTTVDTTVTLNYAKWGGEC